MNSIVRFLFALCLVLSTPTWGVIGCNRTETQGQRFHCPMHPTYVADHPGDCPICGMRLVKIEEARNAPKVNRSQEIAPTTPRPEASALVHSDAGVGDWVCSMCPEIVSHSPGRCPKCGMALERVSAKNVTHEMGPNAEPVPGKVPVEVHAEAQRLASIRTIAAREGRIARSIRAAGVIRADETRVRHVHTKTSGWIEKLYVNFTGETVAKGRPILSIFSQELLLAQHEYVQAKQTASAFDRSTLLDARANSSEIVAAALRRLELLDVPKSSIAQLDQGKPPSRTVTIVAPVGGTVMSKSVFEGQQIEPGTELFTVADLSHIWIEADVYESEMNAIRLGQEAKITVVGSDAEKLTAKIKYIYPYLNAETRTLRVRFTFPNPGLWLKLEGFVNVEIPVETETGAIVPDSSIIDTGLRQIVFVNTHDDWFEPRAVKVGVRAEGQAQILHGVAVGERVVDKANFLLDSESRLRAVIQSDASGSAQP